MRFLYLRGRPVSDNQPSDKAFTGMLSQAEAQYVPLSTVKGKACANCRWFMNDGCFIVASYDPEPIIATGYCNRHETAPVPDPDTAEVITEAVVEAVEVIAETFANAPLYTMEHKPQKATLKERIAKLFKREPKDDAFSVFKGVDDKWHWHAVFTNNFEDREGEILTERAHDDYIARLDMGLVPMPVLQRWHTPGTEHGKATMLWRSGHFVHAIGDFDDTPLAQKAITYYRKNAGKSLMSHGFMSPEWAFDGKHYNAYNTIEITTLPPFAAANLYTSFEELKEMALTEEKQRDLENVFGKDFVAALVARDEQHGKALEDMSVTFKDFSTATPEPEKPVTNDREKSLGELYSDLVTENTELIKTVTVLGKALKVTDDGYKARVKELEKKFDDETQAWQGELDKLKALVNQPPRRAAHDASTAVTDADKLKQADFETAASGEAGFFGVKVKS